MPYRIAGIDVHKKMLAVVVSDVEVDGEFDFERRMLGSNPEQLRALAAWLLELEVEETSTATWNTCAAISKNSSRDTTIASACTPRWATVLRKNLNSKRSIQIP